MGIVLKEPAIESEPKDSNSCEEEKLGKILSSSLTLEERMEYMEMLKKDKDIMAVLMQAEEVVLDK